MGAISQFFDTAEDSINSECEEEKDVHFEVLRHTHITSKVRLPNGDTIFDGDYEACLIRDARESLIEFENFTLENYCAVFAKQSHVTLVQNTQGKESLLIEAMTDEFRMALTLNMLKVFGLLTPTNRDRMCQDLALAVAVGYNLNIIRSESEDGVSQEDLEYFITKILIELDKDYPIRFPMQALDQ